MKLQTKNVNISPPAPEMKRIGWKQVLQKGIQNCMVHNVLRNAAALAYYLLFALFPLMIFVSNLLGLLHLDIGYITNALSAVLPQDIVNLLASYLEYVSETSSGALMWFSLVFTIWFPMRAAGGLMDDVRLAYHLPKPQKPLVYRIKQLVFTLVLLVVIALTLVLSILGQRILDLLIGWIPSTRLAGSTAFFINAWHYLRFIVAGVVMFVTLGALYTLPQDVRQPIRKILPGTVLALICWLAVSVIFSFYVNNFANYTVIYGTLGAVIALLSWLYMTAILLIMGAEVNAALNEARSN